MMAHVMYAGWMAMVISEMARVLDEGGMLLLQVGSTRDELDRIVPLDILLYETIKKTGLIFQNRIIWTVPHGLSPRRRLAGRHETVLCFSKGAPRVFNPTPGRTPQKDPGKRAFKGPRRGELSGHPLGAWPSDVWAIPNIGANNGERTGHPAQMPEELARRAIQIYTNAGDLVIDPFSGSGTTHKVCIETGRRFSGADLFYSDLRNVRLAKAGLASVCPLPGVTDDSVAVWQAEAVRVDYSPQGELSLPEAA